MHDITRESNIRLIDEAGIILLVCDVHLLTEEDFGLSSLIRKSGKPCILVINKVDNTKRDELIYEFYELGYDDPLPLSAEHGRNIEQLRIRIAEYLRDEYGQGRKPNEPTRGVNRVQQEPTTLHGTIDVAIVGKPNVGKSSLLNLLVEKQRSLVLPEPGTTRDAVDERVTFQGHTLRFIDTAGLRKRRKIRENVEFYSLVRSEAAIRDAAVSVLVLDATSGVTAQDKKIAWIIAENRRAMLIAANKWDLRGNQVREKDFIEETYYLFPHALFADVIPVSALTGYNKTTLLKNIIKVYNNYHSSIQTSDLNDFIRHLALRRGDIKYGYQQRKAPPGFEFFVRNLDLNDRAFKRYLANALREEFQLRGVPIDISLRNR
jgi:GTP-binding protein